jgi:NAD(P)-dependent dehydrogenase (short-subunit alcohol dehydrogenase family)
VNGASKIYSIDIGETGDDFQTLSARFPNQLFVLKADVTQESSISAAVDRIVEEAGALHGMVVNAGRTNHKEIETLFSVNVGFCATLTC